MDNQKYKITRTVASSKQYELVVEAIDEDEVHDKLSEIDDLVGNHDPSHDYRSVWKLVHADADVDDEIVEVA